MTPPTKAEAYLKRPYQRVLIPDPEEGGYTAKITEFPGCVTEGDTAVKALKRLEDAAESWIEAVLDMGQAVPEPMAEQEYSGKLMLRLSRSLHRRAAEMAHGEGVSLNQFIVTTLAERVGASEAKATTGATVVLTGPLWGAGIPVFSTAEEPSISWFRSKDLNRLLPMEKPVSTDQAAH